jgi:hypothetical protein
VVRNDLLRKSREYHERMAELGMPTFEARMRERDIHGADLQDCEWYRQSEQPSWFAKAVNRGTRGTSGLDNLVKPRSKYEYT